MPFLLSHSDKTSCDFKDQYHVAASLAYTDTFPTILFINPKTGVSLHDPCFFL